MVEDGMYDVIVVDAVARDDDAMAIEVAISSGARRGEVVALVARGLGASDIDLLAAPATLIVEKGSPRLVLD